MAVRQDGRDVEQVELTEAAPSYESLERAIGCVPGVVSASVTRSEATGRSRLRIRLAPGEHAETASWAVAATLRERFGIALDPADIRSRSDETVIETPSSHEPPHHPDHDPVRLVDRHGVVLSETRDRLTSAARAALDGIHEGVRGDPSESDHTTGPTDEGDDDLRESTASPDRVEIRNLDTQCDPQAVRATAVLSHRGRTVHGMGASVPTSHGILRAVAEATIDGVRALTGPTLLAGVDAITLQPAGDPSTVAVVVTLLADQGEQTLLGSSVVRRDAEHAVMRATLDALNRRVALMLDDAAPSGQPL